MINKYFSESEFDCKCGKCERPKNVPSDELIEILTEIREHYGKPLIINSGYRCPALNKAVGGTTKSQHISGEAADITAGSKSANRRLFNLLRSLRLPVDQVIDEHDFSWIHVSHSRVRNRMMFFSAQHTQEAHHAQADALRPFKARFAQIKVKRAFSSLLNRRPTSTSSSLNGGYRVH